ncbi:hypothetical protein ACFQFC_37015 [Amorphoplanes digitatis]|uniref:Uncharacterized protein n=1 Tax=Actinoplanes digitatis TaxID=1868 RepID=A0A7W7HVW0_9ACTN|nr:hypothetical protein [Actinoplanes digitatis]MBB4761762.1 hypothetical protein [Actinoplanes digitatis]
MTSDAPSSGFASEASEAVQGLIGAVVGRVGVSRSHGLVLDFGRPIRRADEGSRQRGEQRLTTHNADWRLDLGSGTLVGSGDDVDFAQASGKELVGSVVFQIGVDLRSLEASIAFGASTLRIFPSCYKPSGWRNDDAQDPLPYWRLWLPSGETIAVGPGMVDSRGGPW